jgi:hypothetical protein
MALTPCIPSPLGLAPFILEPNLYLARIKTGSASKFDPHFLIGEGALVSILQNLFFYHRHNG